ncbi:MAG: SpoIID/LytB domain-containing protein [Elusimicrobiota bacterium]
MSAPLLGVLLVLLAPPAAASDAEQAQRDAYAAFLQGRYDDSANGWRYLQTLNVAAASPDANEALVDRDAGKPDAAAPAWIKASLQEAAGGFAWNQRAWSFLALGQARQAKESFEKAIDRSSTTATQAEADLGLGLGAILDDRPKAGLDVLRRAGLAGPYAIAVSAQLTAEIAASLGDKETALSYLRQSLEIDPYNREALRALVRLLDKIGDNRGAWLTARRALALDPSDDQSRRILKRNASFITGDPDEASGVRRIARPVLDPDSTEPALPVSTRTVRVGLYGAPDGRPATLTRCYLVMNSSFKVTAAAYGVMRDNGNAYDQWQIEYRADSGVVEVRDSAHNLLFTSKQPFMFVPSAERGSVLIKSAAVADSAAVDLGDREVRGSVEVFPNPWGFKLVEQVPLEQYLAGVVSLALPDGSPPEAYRAQAVVSRTAAAWAMGHHPQTQENFDLLDDRSVQPTVGVSGEMHAGGEGVAATEGLVLSRNGLVAYAPQHDDSGGRTESGAESGEAGMDGLASVPDGPRAFPAWTSPLDVERFVHEAPPEGLYSEAAPGATASTARWMRLLDAKDLRARVDAKKKVGRLLRVLVAGRTSTGRVKALTVVGADGTVSYSGFAEIQGLLSPGSLRSSLFTLQPLYDGKSLSRLVIWGAGTGSGLGFPRAGALGQAALGKPWKEIVKHYFPAYELRDLYHPPAPASSAAKRGSGPYRRTLNYRGKKPQ